MTPTPDETTTHLSPTQRAPQPRGPLVEICLEDLEGVAVAEREGADRIELCADLAEGGITPSLGTVAQALRAVRAMPIFVLVRQRPGDFVYTSAEVAAMVDDIRAMRDLPNPAGVTLGFVIGALTDAGGVDATAVRQLVAAAAGHPVTFHKAFDEIADQPAALEELIELGLGRILTSGGAPTAAEGADSLVRLTRLAGARIGILAAGGIRPGNAADLVARTGVTEIHLRAPEPDAERHITSPTVVRSAIAEVRPAAE